MSEREASCPLAPRVHPDALCDNPDVRGFFKPGTSYYLDITEAA